MPDIMKSSWVDEDEDILPQPTRSEPDSNGVVTVVEYFKDDKGDTIKVTKKIKQKKITTRINPAVAERKKWTKFGHAAKHGANGPHVSTTNVCEEQIVEYALKSLIVFEEPKSTANDIDPTKSKSVVCRNCKGDHWTLKCPYKDLIQDINPEEPAKKTEEKPSVSKGASTGKYVPPSMRGGAVPSGSTDKKQRDDHFSVRVSNISEDVEEAQLKHLFGKCGQIARVFLAKDKITGARRGYGFINFYSRDDAHKAVEKMNGFGLQNLILNVELAQSRSD